MPRQPRPIAAYLGKPGPFYRSISIERDRHDAVALRGYVLTPWLERTATELLGGLLPGSRRRAWRVTGDFGVGKSALALALLRALDPATADPEAPMQGVADAMAGELPRMFPLVLTGSRAGLDAALATAVADTARTRTDLLGDSAGAEFAGLDPVAAIIALRDAVSRSGQYDGLLLVVDEMGKFLETAAADPTTGDVFRLQELAEAASRSGERPLAVLLILHQGVQSYVQEGAATARTEWAKVAERFEEIVFDHPLTHTSSLLSAAIAPDVRRLPAGVLDTYAECQERVAALGWLGPRGERTPASTYPLHPACVPVLARFFAAYGQNERSLFGFAASEEPNGLRAFAAANAPESGFYGLDRFFDYVSTSFGHRLVARGGAGDWERIRAVLDGTASATPVETAVLKTVGLLNLLDAPDLVADEASLGACLAPSFACESIIQALASLKASGILFERLARTGLRLWTSRRIDLSALWAEADQAVTPETMDNGVATTLAATQVRPFLLARRHSIQTGVTRRFPIRLVAASSLGSTKLDRNADGSIVAVIPDDPMEERHASTWAAEATTDDPTLVVLTAPPLAELRALVVDLLRHRWIEANAPALREDAHAAAEIERRLAELQATLVDRLEAILGLSGEPPRADVRVYRSGAPLTAPPPIHLLVTRICDDLYRQAPLVQNELINRHALTSAAAAARQRLIEAMFAHAQDADLGIGDAKNPPERALYLSVLRRGGIHRERDGIMGVDLPDPADDPLRLRPALTKVRELIEGTGGRIGIDEIYRVLGARPFGVRAGLSPVLLATVLAADRHRIALFERGTYCPKLDGQAFMRILKAPENFQLQWVALEGVRAEVYRRLARVLGGDDGQADKGLLAVVSPLIRFAAGLPFHVQRSADLSERSRAVLDALLRARSPVELVFTDLPSACGLAPFPPNAHGNAHSAAEFAARLEASIAVLQACYPSLLDRMRTELATALNVSGEVRGELAARSEPLVFRVREQGMRTFIQRISDRALSDDAWTEALGGALLGKPPARWLAADVQAWRGRLEDLGPAFLRLEAAAFGSKPHDRTAVRLALTHLDGREHTAVLSLDGETPEQELFTRSLLQLIEKNGVPPSLVLARLADELLRPSAANAGETKSAGEPSA